MGYFLPTLSAHSWSKYTTPAAVVFLALPTFYGLYKTVGLRHFALTATSLGVFGILIETIGIYTCFPYGCFSYGESMGAKLFGTTPWTIAFAWAPLVLGAYALVWKPEKSNFKLIAQGTTLLVVIDLVLDPVAAALGFWIWESPGLYYGIPFSNFMGWILSGTMGMYITTRLLQTRKPNVWLISTVFLSLALWLGATARFGFFIPFLLALCVLYICLLITGIAHRH